MPTTNVSSASGSVTVDVSSADTVVFGVSGTYAEFSGNFSALPTGASVYQPIGAPRLDAGLEPGPKLLTNATRAWRFSTKGLSSVKLQFTELTSGTVVVETATAVDSGGVITVGSSVLAGGTTGSIIFVGAGGVWQQDNANLFYDDTNNRIGFGQAVPLQRLHVKAPTVCIRVEGSSSNRAWDIGPSVAGNLVFTDVSGGISSSVEINTGKFATNFSVFVGDVYDSFPEVIKATAGTVSMRCATFKAFSAAQSGNLVEFQSSAAGIMGQVGPTGLVSVPGQVCLTADVNNATTTLATTGLTANVRSTRKIGFHAFLPIATATALEGVKVTMAGTATITNLLVDYEIKSHASTPVLTIGRKTAFDDPVGQTVADAGNASIEIWGTLESNAAGTLRIDFAKNALEAGNNTTVKRGAWFKIWDIL